MDLLVRDKFTINDEKNDIMLKFLTNEECYNSYLFKANVMTRHVDKHSFDSLHLIILWVLQIILVEIFWKYNSELSLFRINLLFG